jgi:hypothetical protein
MKRTIVGFTFLLCLGATTAAHAQKDRRQGDLNVFLKGGIGGFTGALNDYSAVGPSWGAVVNLQPWRSLGLELGYEGSRHGITDDRLEDAALTRNGIDALLKLSPPLIERVKPFLGVGLGASYVSVNNGAGLYKNDVMEEVPLATGLELNSGALTAGVRATYRFLVDEGFADRAQPVGNPNGGLFDFGASVGARF